MQNSSLPLLPLKTIRYVLPDEPALTLFAKRLAQCLLRYDRGWIIFLEGDLGAGKTTFARGFLRGLGYQDKVKSPTYTLVEPYDIEGGPVFHFDLYRLQDAKELMEIGCEDYFTPEAICLVEWPDKGAPFVPTPDLLVQFMMQTTGRLLVLHAYTVKGQQLLETLG